MKSNVRDRTHFISKETGAVMNRRAERQAETSTSGSQRPDEESAHAVLPFGHIQKGSPMTHNATAIHTFESRFFFSPKIVSVLLWFLTSF